MGLVEQKSFYSSLIFFAAFLCLPFLPSVSDCKQSGKQRKGQVSVRFPVKIQNNDDDGVCESESGHNSIKVLYLYFLL